MRKLDSLPLAVLADLLADFMARDLTADDLRAGYEGLSLTDLKANRLASGATNVDYDLALKELEESALIGTGPMAAYENDPNSGVMILGIYSKREFAYLTELGYRTANQSKATAKPAQRSEARPSVHISGGTFHQSPIGIGGHVTQAVSVNIENQTEVIEYLLQLLSSSGAKIDAVSRAEVKQLVEVTTNGDLASAKPIFQRLFAEATDGIKQVAWGVVSSLAAKFLGI
ncbi:hypothetical protein ACFW16_24720 [Inquilinus sp. NPDC058860]|uniref:hypothetical protein n=1 Tax=Inquilinus sp. NPDC058860 TaxID=3346652 RepID=UPI0036C6A393